MKAPTYFFYYQSSEFMSYDSSSSWKQFIENLLITRDTNVKTPQTHFQSIMRLQRILKKKKKTNTTHNQSNNKLCNFTSSQLTYIHKTILRTDFLPDRTFNFSCTLFKQQLGRYVHNMCVVSNCKYLILLLYCRIQSSGSMGVCICIGQNGTISGPYREAQRRLPCKQRSSFLQRSLGEQMEGMYERNY